MSSPKARSASPRARSSASASFASSRTMRMPRPPPPALALTITGKPSARAASSASASGRRGSSLPGTTGTPAAAMMRREPSFEPIARITSPRRADEADAALRAQVGEGAVLGQEAVARVDRVGADPLRDRDDALHRQVGLPAPARARTRAPRRPGARGSASRSASETIAAVGMPSSRPARNTRAAISPRLATSSLRNTRAAYGSVRCPTVSSRRCRYATRSTLRRATPLSIAACATASGT